MNRKLATIGGTIGGAGLMATGALLVYLARQRGESELYGVASFLFGYMHVFFSQIGGRITKLEGEVSKKRDK